MQRICAGSVSTHALREEGDRGGGRYAGRRVHFNPRPPRGGRPYWPVALCGTELFQSTPSARRATSAGQQVPPESQYFNPRPPRGGRRLAKIIGHALNAISIHALREEGDIAALSWSTPSWGFQSTPSARRATAAAAGSGLGLRFQSTPSARRATLWRLGAICPASGFQSTPSARRATFQHHFG